MRRKNFPGRAGFSARHDDSFRETDASAKSRIPRRRLGGCLAFLP